MTLKIARGFTLPHDAVTQAIAAIGRRGSGKTNLAGILVERLLDAREQVIVLDPVGAWWSLRLEADGKTAAYDVPVFGGMRVDVPIRLGASTLPSR